MKCIHCKAILKTKLGKPFWFTAVVTILSYSLIYILLMYQPIDMSIFPAWLFIFILVYMLVLLAATAFTAVLFLKFEEVPEEIEKSNN